jgi:branched-chain amino acid transport system permease protein
VTTETTYGDVPREGELVDIGQIAPPRAPGAKRARPYVVRRRTGPHRALVAAGLLAAVAVLWWGGHIGQFNQGQLTRVMIYAIAIAGLNIATGYTGMVSVGHSAFFGLGAYTTGILMTEAGWRAEYTIPVALVVCFVAGLVVGLPALRIRGLYLAVVTLAFGVAFPEIIGRFPGLTGGTQGLTISFDQLRPPTWTGYTLGQQGLWLYWLSAAVLVIVMVIVHNLVRSRFGLAMMAARDNEIAASSSGVDLAAVKVLSFGISGALTGVGGSLFAVYLGSLTATDSFTLLNAIALLTGLVIGGSGTRFGPIIGAIGVVYIPYYTSNLGQGESSAVLFGAALILIVFVAPEGLVGAFFRLLRRVLVVVPALAGDAGRPAGRRSPTAPQESSPPGPGDRHVGAASTPEPT